MVNAGKGMCARETGAGFPCAYNKRPPEKAACGGPVLRSKTAVTKKKGTHNVCPFLFGDPYRIRTDVKGVRGLCLNHLTNGPYGTPSGTRTLDTLIKSQVLYQLS